MDYRAGSRREAAVAAVHAGIRELHPGYFALVMATGIMSVALDAAGAGWLSVLLMWLTIGSFLVLARAPGWRLTAARRSRRCCWLRRACCGCC